MNNCCVIGTGNRFDYFYPILEYLIKIQKISINGIANKSGNFKNNCKYLTKNLFNNYEEMIKKTNPDIVIILVNANHNYSLAKNILENYTCKIYIETPIYGANLNNLKNNNRIHILENWIYLPLEILKKKIIKSEILGKITKIINDHRTYSYHGIAQIRNYENINNFTDIKKNNNETIFYSNNKILIHRKPKIKNKKIIIKSEKYSIVSDCIVDKNKDDNLTIFSKDKIYKPIFEFKNTILKNIKIEINGTEFSWINEYDTNLDQYQYGSLKSILNAFDNNYYTIQEHIYDLM